MYIRTHEGLGQVTATEVYNALSPSHSYLDETPPSIGPFLVLDKFYYGDIQTPRSQMPKIQILATDILSLLLVSQPPLTVRLVGHTDNHGTSLAANITLGLKRAANVRELLKSEMESMQRGSSQQIIFLTRSRGPTQPVADNSTSVGRRLNRRVEVFL